MTHQPPPTTVDEAVRYLLSVLSDDVRAALLDMQRDDTIALHRDYGMNVRNTLGLWGSNRQLLADPAIAGMFADDASDYLIKRLWDALHAG